MIIETNRLRFRKLIPKDFHDLALLLQDEDVMYAYEGAFTDLEVRSWLEKRMSRYEKDGFGLWGVELKGCSGLIGQCGITYQDCKGETVPEIGYLFRKEFWHKGYATESAIACREYAFQVLGFERIYSIIRDSNEASRKVAERNGMRKVGEMMKHYRGVDMLHYIYCIERADRLPEPHGCFRKL